MRFVNHHHGCSGFVPTRPDGSEWAHVFVLDDGAVVHADTETEVVEALIPGYAALPLPQDPQPDDPHAETPQVGDDARRQARAAHAERLAATVQERWIQRALTRGHLDPAQADDNLLMSILRLPKSEGLLLATPDAPGQQAPWQGPVRLILVTTSYAPYTDIPPALGDVTWLDPSEEGAYLRSLRDAGVRDYWAAASSATAS